MNLISDVSSFNQIFSALGNLYAAACPLKACAKIDTFMVVDNMAIKLIL